VGNHLVRYLDPPPADRVNGSRMGIVPDRNRFQNRPALIKDQPVPIAMVALSKTEVLHVDPYDKAERDSLALPKKRPEHR